MSKIHKIFKSNKRKMKMKMRRAYLFSLTNMNMMSLMMKVLKSTRKKLF